jgi:hypothetical protein
MPVAIIPGQTTLIFGRDFPCDGPHRFAPVSCVPLSDGNLPSRQKRKVNFEGRDATAKNDEPAMVAQADRRSRFLALIWDMRMGPSENSPSPAFRVNSRK